MAKKVAKGTSEHRCSEGLLSTTAATTTFPAATNNTTQGKNTTVRDL